MGNAVGNFLQDVLQEKYGDTIQFEVPVDDPDNNFSGNIDGLLRVGDNHIAVLEFKSIKHGGFTKLKKAKPEHATQVASYAQRVGQTLADEGITAQVEAWVIYVDKDNYDLVEFPVDIDEWGGKATRILNVLNYYGDRIPPRFPDAGRRKWPCGWCNWRTECLGGTK
jgi:predicted RecB family nuclease